MRILALVLLTAVLAGCTAPPEETDPLIGVCPQWIVGDWETTIIAANGTVIAGPSGEVPLEHAGFPLDRYVLNITEVHGTPSLRAFSNGTQRGILDLRDPAAPQALPVLVLDNSAVGHEFVVFLSAVQHGTVPAPGALEVQVGNGSVRATVTAWYRVCGAPITSE